MKNSIKLKTLHQAIITLLRPAILDHCFHCGTRAIGLRNKNTNNVKHVLTYWTKSSNFLYQNASHTKCHKQYMSTAKSIVLRHSSQVNGVIICQLLYTIKTILSNCMKNIVKLFGHIPNPATASILPIACWAPVMDLRKLENGYLCLSYP